MDMSTATSNTAGHKRKEPSVQKKIRVLHVVVLTLMFTLLLLVSLAAFYALTPQSTGSIMVNNRPVEIDSTTTYTDLKELGYFDAPSGNMLAIDGSVFEVGGGEPPQVYSFERPVLDSDTIIKAGDLINDEPGADTVEPSELSEVVTPATVELAAGDNFQFYGTTLHMVVSPGQDGLAVVETGQLSGVSLTKEVIREVTPRVYGDYLPRFSEGQKVVALTYDDGPHPVYTQQMLAVLGKHGVRATFFMLGTSVEGNPSAAQQVRDAGHQIASHSYSHAPEHYLSNLDEAGVAYQLSTAQSAIYGATGVETKVVRPPGGYLNALSVVAGAPWADVYVGWDIDTKDFSQPGTDAIVDSVLTNVQPGSIVLMHDGGGNRQQTVEATDIIIRELLSRGYRFVTIDELVQMTLASS